MFKAFKIILGVFDRHRADGGSFACLRRKRRRFTVTARSDAPANWRAGAGHTRAAQHPPQPALSRLRQRRSGANSGGQHLHRHRRAKLLRQHVLVAGQLERANWLDAGSLELRRLLDGADQHQQRLHEHAVAADRRAVMRGCCPVCRTSCAASRTAAAGSMILANLPAGSIFSVVGAPSCSEGMIWWQVNYNGQSGWTAEGQDSNTGWNLTADRRPPTACNTCYPTQTPPVCSRLHRHGRARCAQQSARASLAQRAGAGVDGARAKRSWCCRVRSAPTG